MQPFRILIQTGLELFDGRVFLRLVLGPIVLAHETKQNQPLLPADFLRQLMGFYGDTLRTLLACYLEFSLLTFTNEDMRKQMTQTPELQFSI